MTINETKPIIAETRPKLFTQLANLGKNEWWRFLISLVLVFSLWQLVGSLPYGLYVILGGSDSLIKYLTLSLGFIFFLGATLLAVKFIHHRPMITLITPESKISWKRILVSAAVWAVISIFITLIDHIIHPGTYQLNFQLPAWLLFSLAALILTPIQSSAEEVFFRGYLMQQISLLVKQKWLLIPISGILFAIPHFLNPEMALGFWILAAFYFSFGAYLAWLTIRTNNLEYALGIHAANNLFTIMIANYTNSAVASPSIFLATKLDPIYNLISFLVGAVMFWFIMRGIDHSNSFE